MTDLTTTHLQRLLWQSTPGPWEYDPGNAPDGRCIIDAELWNMCIAIEANNEGSSCSDAELELAAHAPELAQELIRLREHIEGIIAAMEVKAATGESQSPAIIAGYLKEKVLGDHDE